jgi:OmpA-OmpF porin, OOP family
VNGYTDTSGTPRYNIGLSIRRAQAFAGDLVRDGAPATVIAIRGLGRILPACTHRRRARTTEQTR